MKKRMFKITALILSAVLLVTGTFYFTLAYLQAKSNPVVNTFTAGKIKLTLTETKVDELGKPLYFDKNGVTKNDVTGEETPAVNDVGTTSSSEDKQTIQVLANDYKLMPGESYVKDPTLTIEKGSEPCYVYLAVYDGITYNFDSAEFNTVHEQLLSRGWKLVSEEDEKYGDDASNQDFVGLSKYLPWALEGENSDLGYFLTYQFLASSEDVLVRNGGMKLYYYGGSTEGDDTAYKVDASGNEEVLPTFQGFTISQDYESFEELFPADELAEGLDVNVDTIITVAFAVQSQGFDSWDTSKGETELDAVKRAWLATFGKID